MPVGPVYPGRSGSSGRPRATTGVTTRRYGLRPSSALHLPARSNGVAHGGSRANVVGCPTQVLDFRWVPPSSTRQQRSGSRAFVACYLLAAPVRPIGLRHPRFPSVYSRCPGRNSAMERSQARPFRCHRRAQITRELRPLLPWDRRRRLRAQLRSAQQAPRVNRFRPLGVCPGRLRFPRSAPTHLPAPCCSRSPMARLRPRQVLLHLFR